MLIALFAALGLASPVHVQASLLQVRQAPAPDAEAVAWLRIGTAVEVVDEDGDWVQVYLTDRPVDHPVQGWVLGRFLDVDAPTPEALERAVTQTRDPEARGRMEARREALLGGAIDAHQPVQVAICEGSRVELLGAVEPDGMFTDRSQWTPSTAQLMDLSAVHWTATAPDGEPHPVVGSPFVRPFVTDRWNEKDVSPWAPGTCDGICEEPAHVILGPCDQEGTLYTSQPVAQTTLDGAVEHVPMHTPHGDYVATVWTPAGSGWSAEIQLGETELGATVAAPRQTNQVVLPGGRTLAVGELIRKTTRGWSLVVVDTGSAMVWDLYVEGWGC